LYQFSHSHDDPTHYCQACGQPLPQDKVPSYGPRQHNRVGIGISIALHLLIVLFYLFKPKDHIVLTPPAKEGAMVWVAPVAPSKPKPITPSKQAKPEAPKSARAHLPPNPNAITERIKPQEVLVPPAEAKLTPTPADVPDMQAMIERNRRARNAEPVSSEPSAESEAQAAKNRAMANIMGAQGRAANGERNDTGGVFQVVDKTFNSADIKFRGFSSNFKRNWSQQVHVEQGLEKDIETAIVKKMVEMIRKEKPGDFIWESHRLGRNVPMSARKEDEKELTAFLLLEFFPQYGKLR
jgi:hypothetical protein